MKLVLSKFVEPMFTKEVSVKSSVLGGKGLFAEEAIAKGEEILRLGGKVTGRRPPDQPYSMRLGKRLFLVDSHNVDNYVNHSCAPSARIDFNTLYLRAKQDLNKGEEITFNYCATEFRIDKQFWFTCRCGSEGCYGRVRGFFYLSQVKKRAILHDASPYIRSKWSVATGGPIPEQRRWTGGPPRS